VVVAALVVGQAAEPVALAAGLELARAAVEPEPDREPIPRQARPAPEREVKTSDPETAMPERAPTTVDLITDRVQVPVRAPGLARAQAVRTP